MWRPTLGDLADTHMCVYVEDKRVFLHPNLTLHQTTEKFVHPQVHVN